MRRVVAAVHVESVQRFDELIDDSYFVFAMGIVDTFSAEQAVEGARILETDILNLLVVVGFAEDAGSAGRLELSAHLGNLE